MKRVRLYYRPIDETLTELTFQILRAASRFDWATSEDLNIALDIPSKDVDKQRRNAFDVVLSRLARTGYLERTGRPCTYQYRISEQGRREIERRLQRNAA